MSTLLQLDALTDVHRAIRDRFQEGGSVTSAVLALLTLALLVALAYFLTEWQRRAATRGAVYDNPRALFRNLLEELKISGEDRKWLEALAKETGTAHPATLLISIALFDEQTSKWQGSRREGEPIPGLARRVGIVRDRLFPDA